MNVIYGRNAQGKTNLLEAIWLFTGGRSFRGARDGELVAFGQEKAALQLQFYSEEREQEAGLTIQNGRRSASLNGVPKRSPAELVGKFRAVLFSPEHLSLIKSGPALRRNFIDAALCQVKPAYAPLLSRYAVARERAAYIQKIEAPARELYAGISENKEQFGIQYQKSAENLREALAAARRDDLQSGHTTVGPHRDDLEVTVDGVSARAYGSQGQQRSLVLALKLAEADVLEQEGGEAPVILLDDVMSELDAGRQHYLLNRLDGRQVFLTCCEPGAVKRLEEGALFEVRRGELYVPTSGAGHGD